MKSKLLILSLILFSCIFSQAENIETQIMYLSGHDADDPVEWDFRCSDGHNSGKWTHIDVPSCWEQQGFGNYTYGRFYLDKTAKPSSETGEYRRTFSIPSDWKGNTVKLVFEGVMTDTSVKINGKSAGSTHQGGFTAFSYDISNLLKYGGENTIEVFVKKESDNKSINAAERRADWWLFGGIYRPVYLEVLPKIHINKVMTDAKADGTLNLHLQTSNIPKGCILEAEIDGNEPKTVSLENTDLHNVSFKFDSIKKWDPEHPNLYNLKLSLKDNKGNVLHKTNQKIGFRTIEFIPQDGFYLNGTRLIIKGINRHCFYPETGRTTSKRRDLEDIKLIKGMNANAIRSHYPPDKHLLELCDSLGVLYFDELPGWQDPYDNSVGPRILTEMVEHDANHPSIFAWGNGNEGGFNYDLLPLFDTIDIQGRKVVHPWALRDGIDAHHYPAYQTGVGRLGNGYQVFMPTEFLHSKYDKGGGASLDDYWHNWSQNPLFAGGFIWAFLDEGIKRTDKNGEIDTNGGNGPDGIVGPNREKEASWYTIRDVWSPIQIQPVTLRQGKNTVLNFQNKSLFNNLADYEMHYEVIEAGIENGEKILAKGEVELRDAQPNESVNIRIGPENGFSSGTYLKLTAFLNNDTINEWSLPLQYAAEFSVSKSQEAKSQGQKYEVSILQDSNLMLEANRIQVIFDSKTGMISKVRNGNREIPFNNGPIPVGMSMELTDIKTIDSNNEKKIIAHYRGAVDSIVWTMTRDGILSMDAVLLNRKNGGKFDGKFVDDEIRNFGFSFSYPEAMCDGLTWIGKGPYRVWRNRQRGQNFGLWHKDYNNTVTGQPANGKLIYPEFKGYHANVYEARIESEAAPFTVSTTTDGLYLRMFTPEEPSSKINTSKTMESFPPGDISFLLDIAPIGSYKPLDQLGPKAIAPNVRINKGDEGLHLNLRFDFCE